MSNLTSDEVSAVLGDVDDLYLERIVATGATISELSEALDDLEDERRFGEQHTSAASPRVAAVRAILEELVEDTEDEVPEYGTGDSTVM